MIWDFRGPEAKRIAQHHEVHLKDYVKIEQIKNTLTGTETVSNIHTIAFLVVDETHMLPIKNALKPHRGQVYKE